MICELSALDFELAFAVVHGFGLDPCDTFSAVGEHFARAGDLSGIQRLLANIRGTTLAPDFDKVIERI